MYSAILIFLGASIALTIAPGPDNIFVITQGVSRGRKAAVITAWGMCSGISVHTLASALGVSAVFYTSALAFQVVKYAGAAYLLYLAYKAIREQNLRLKKRQNAILPTFSLYKRGFIMNVLNPKVALFFLAFLPQFVDKNLGQVGLQMIGLGLIFMLQTLVIFSAIGYFSGTLGNYIITNPKIAKYFNWLSAGIFASLGLKLALAER